MHLSRRNSTQSDYIQFQQNVHTSQQSSSSASSRTPLAPLPTQFPSSDDFSDKMPISTSQIGPVRDSDRDLDHTSDPHKYGIARPISANRSTEDDNLSTSSRRRSIPGHSSSSSNPRSLPYPQSRLTQRRPSNTPSASVSTSYHPSSHIPSDRPAAFNDAFLPPMSEDIYSGLSTFSFGAAQPSSYIQTSPVRSEHGLDTISPLTRILPPQSADQTPRPSISGPSGVKTSPAKSRSGKLKSSEGADAGLGDDENEDEEDMQRHRRRSKMRAIDDGSRRPSLPTNIYIPPSPPTPNISPVQSPSRSQQRSPSSTPDRESGPDDSEEHEDVEGDLDTDVELEQNANGDYTISDNASVHTFGGGFDHYGFSSGNVSLRDDMSIREEDEDSDRNDEREPSISPVTFTRAGYDSDGVDVMEMTTRNPRDTSRTTRMWNHNSLSISSPQGVDESGQREREDSMTSMATVTGRQPIRHAGDDYAGSITDVGSQPSSLPQTRADFSTLDAQSIHRTSIEGTIGPEQASASNAWDGLDMDYIMGNRSDSRRSFIAESIIGETANRAEEWPFGRRPSTMTIGNEDVFTKFVRKMDKGYDERRQAWTFKRETVDGRGPAGSRNSNLHISDLQTLNRTMSPNSQEIWKQSYIGRFKVDRLALHSEQPDKAAQQRINVRHITDPYSLGNTRGGPASVIHKHSRAIAFSIFRTHSLFSTQVRRANHMSTSISILLATKKVQEQYTSTRTTSKLNSHGLLEDNRRPLPKNGNTGPTKVSGKTASSAPTTSGGSVSTASRDSSTRGRQLDASPAKSSKGKGKAVAKPEEIDGNISSGIGPSTHTATMSSGQSNVAESIATSTSHSSGPISQPGSPVSRHQPTHTHAVSMSSEIPSETVRPSTDETMYSPKATILTASPSDTMLSHSNSTRSLVTRSDVISGDSDEDEQSPPRTSHAEAFATVDSNYLEYMRGRSEPRIHPEHESGSHSLVGALRRRLLGQGVTKAGSKQASSSSGSAGLEANYTPPWLTMAPRSKQEERERVIQNLNESFKDVGLLPSFRPNKGQAKGKSKKTTSSPNIFANVPADCLYMLLPLWPGETDPQFQELKEDPALFVVPVEERQYLLVYYVPFDEQTKKKEKKRTRAETHTAAAASSNTNTVITLQSFRVCARLVSYKDLNTTGVRLPDHGLSVTGSLIEATKFLPSAAIREMRLDDVVIGICHSRSTGMEFIPEGLAKLGLCMPTDDPIPPAPIREDEEVEEVAIYLTPIGRAAVEMAWLGCMAVTCFGTA
ncbi:hypothetical protein ABKN59_011554 [Abortiporus biennis]